MLYIKQIIPNIILNCIILWTFCKGATVDVWGFVGVFVGVSVEGMREFGEPT